MDIWNIKIFYLVRKIIKHIGAFVIFNKKKLKKWQVYKNDFLYSTKYMRIMLY